MSFPESATRETDVRDATFPAVFASQSHSEPIFEPHVVTVVVTMNRPETLAESLAAILSQSLAPRDVVVVDNGNSKQVATLCAEATTAHSTVHYIASLRNLGGAGGFALGMLRALSLGAEYVWLADDDGRPDGPETLSTLMQELRERNLAMISPVVADALAPQNLAFPTRRALRRITRCTDLVGNDNFVTGFAALFNGALFSAATVDAVGVPDYRLFIRGDEIEMDRRLKRSGLPFGTTGRARYLHPSGAAEFSGALNVEVPTQGFKNYYTFRNRGFLTNQPGKRVKGIAEYAVYTVLFLLKRRSLGEFREWARLMNAGRRERFVRFDVTPEPPVPADHRSSST